MNPLSYLIKHISIYTPQDILFSIHKQHESSSLASLNLQSIYQKHFMELNRERKTLILDSIFDHTHWKASIFRFLLIVSSFLGEESSVLLRGFPGDFAVDFDALWSRKKGCKILQLHSVKIIIQKKRKLD